MDMKKILMIVVMLLAVTGIAHAGQLSDVFAKLQAESGMNTLTPANTDSIMMQLHSSMPLTGMKAVASGFEKGSAGIQTVWNKVSADLSAIPTAPEFRLQSDYSVFLMYAEESADGSGADILAIWQLDFYGRTIVIYGHASADDYQRMLYADLQMNHFGISFNPMSPSRYRKYVELGNLQKEMEAGGTIDKSRMQAIVEEYRQLLREVNPGIGGR